MVAFNGVKVVKGTVAAFGAVATIFAGTVALKEFGLWPASAQAVQQNTARINNLELRGYLQRLWLVEDRIHRLQSENQPVPQDLWQQKADLESWIRQLEEQSNDD